MDEATRFNAANGLRMIVRSHELVRRGWAIGGKKDVVTVFSAADYRNRGNDGASSGASGLASLYTCPLVPACWTDAQHQRR